MGARVIIADSQASFRGMIRALIESAGGYEVVAEASDGLELLACIQQHHPEVVVLDMALPLVDGPEVVRRSRDSGHTPFFLFLSSRSGRAPLHVALRAGVTGYIAKADSAKHLLAAIEAIRGGQAFLASDHLVEIALARDAREPRTLKLSIREQEVLRLIADGLSNKEIADALQISRRTVDSHRSNLMKKLGTRKAVSLVRFAIREGLIDP